MNTPPMSNLYVLIGGVLCTERNQRGADAFI